MRTHYGLSVGIAGAVLKFTSRLWTVPFRTRLRHLGERIESCQELRRGEVLEWKYGMRGGTPTGFAASFAAFLFSPVLLPVCLALTVPSLAASGLAVLWVVLAGKWPQGNIVRTAL